MAYIGKRPEDALRGQASYNAFTGDGSTTTFDVSNLLPDGGQFDVQVFVDNVRQEAGASKSYTIGQDGSGDLKRVTFNVAPDDGAEIYVINPGRETAVVTVNDNTISTAKLQADAVTTAKITDSNVTTAKIADLNVTTGKIAADAITGAKLADDAVDSEHLTDGSVDNVHLAGSIANAKLANSSITINGTAVSLGGSITAGVDWQAVVVADGSTTLSAVAGKGYFLDTNAGVIEAFLPTSPSRGDTIIFVDYAGHFALNKLIINTGGKNIDSTTGGGTGTGVGNEFQVTTNNSVVELVYVDSSQGWKTIKSGAVTELDQVDDYEPPEYTAATGGTVTTSGDYKIHSFTGDGCFVLSSAGNSGGNNQISYMVVAGGGGTRGDTAPGAGAGGFREGRATNDCYTASPLVAPALTGLAAATYPITVGGGGSAGPNYCSAGPRGSNSVFSTITSTGGGGRPAGPAPNPDIRPGGSGSAGGTGNTPPVSPPQGNDGNHGGGGATSAGRPAPGPTGGPGGDGATTHITGSPATYAGGGGGGKDQSGSDSSGGPGGGGAGGNRPGAGQPGTANKGGGAGGPGAANPGASGGKGVVVIRYKFQN